MGLFKDALKFPFKPFKRMWWFWISVIPALAWYLFQTYGGIWLFLLGIVTLPGWIIFAGYIVEINRSIILHRKQELPPVRSIQFLARNGVVYFIIAAIWSAISYYIPGIPYAGWVLWIYLLIITPIMLVRYSITGKPIDGLDIVFSTKLVFGNLGTYIKYLVLMTGIVIVWMLASLPIITAVLTLPAIYFGTLYLFAQFYQETV